MAYINKGFQFFTLFLICSFFIYSCKEDEDTLRPSIEILFPNQFDGFAFDDTLLITAQFSDNIKLVSVSVVLVNSQNAAVKSLVEFKPGSSEFLLNHEYVFDDPYLPGGQYSLRFIAFDGVNTSAKSIEISVSELAEEYTGLLLITQTDIDNYSVYRMPEDSSLTKVLDWEGRFAKSETNSRTRLVYLCSSDLKGVTAFNYFTGKLAWNVLPESNVVNRGFNNMQKSPSGLLLSQYDPSVLMILDLNGKKIEGTDKVFSYQPMLGLEMKDVIVGFYKNEFTQEKQLNLFSRSGGALVKSIYMSEDLIQIHEFGTHDVLLAGNTSTANGWIGKFNFYNNTYSTLYTFSDETVVDVCQLSSDKFFISTNKGVYFYQVSTNVISPYSSLIKNAILEYNALNNQLFLASGKDIYSFVFNQGVFQNIGTTNQKIVDLKILYSK